MGLQDTLGAIQHKVLFIKQRNIIYEVFLPKIFNLNITKASEGTLVNAMAQEQVKLHTKKII